MKIAEHVDCVKQLYAVLFDYHSINSELCAIDLLAIVKTFHLLALESVICGLNELSPLAKMEILARYCITLADDVSRLNAKIAKDMQ